MDNATLTLHRTWLRLLKGGVAAYQTWLDRQTETMETENLRKMKKAFTALDSDTKEK